MKKFASLVFLLILIVVIVAYCNRPKDGGVTSPDQSIGNISPELYSVYSGPENSLTEVYNSRPLYNKEGVKITGGGKARIDFHNQITLTLYNDTNAGEITGALDPNASNFIRMKLFRGGLTGHVVGTGKTADVSVAFGTTIKVMGTRFFVVFDEVSGYTILGNFDGTVVFYPNGGGERNLPPHTMADIGPDGRVDFLELPYNLEIFDRAATDARSAVDALKTLRRKFDQPLPGERVATEPPAVPAPVTVIRYLVVPEGDSYRGDIASEWATDPDGYIVEFKLREGTLLPDGFPFTSSFVRDRLEAEWPYALEGHVSFELVDDYTIVFRLDSSFAYYVLDEMTRFGFEVRQ